MKSLISAVHTAGPAIPSTPRLFWVSNASTAALVISFPLPWIHCEVSSEGRPGQRHEKVPGWSSARSARLGAGPLGGKPPGGECGGGQRGRRGARVPPAPPRQAGGGGAGGVAPPAHRTPREPPG